MVFFFFFADASVEGAVAITDMMITQVKRTESSFFIYQSFQMCAGEVPYAVSGVIQMTTIYQNPLSKSERFVHQDHVNAPFVA